MTGFPALFCKNRAGEIVYASCLKMSGSSKKEIYKYRLMQGCQGKVWLERANVNPLFCPEEAYFRCLLADEAIAI